jgi:hypothetical protein
MVKGFSAGWMVEVTYIPIETYSSNIGARAISFELDSNKKAPGFVNSSSKNDLCLGRLI